MYRRITLVLCLLATTACDREARQVPAKRNGGSTPSMATAEPYRADCRRMCRRTFLDCTGEVLTASGKLTGVIIGRLEATGSWKKLRTRSHRACLKSCLEKKGLGKDTAAIRKCLASKRCDEYARCMKPHVR